MLRAVGWGAKVSVIRMPNRERLDDARVDAETVFAYTQFRLDGALGRLARALLYRVAMSLPRRIVPGCTYEITRRCLGRAYRLRPSREVNELLVFVLGYSAMKHGIELHSFSFLANHYHIVLTDVRGTLPDFLRELNGLAARGINALHGDWETFWAPGSYDNIELLDAATVYRKLVYVIVNPVAAALVAHHYLWPGLITRPRDLGRLERVAKRPNKFFREDGPCNDDVTVTLTIPPALRHLDPEALRQRLHAAVARREAAIARQQRGRRFLGRKNVLRQPRHQSPKTRAPRRKLRPRVASGANHQLRRAAIVELQRFRADYREALVAFCAGNRDVLFPRGTYLLSVYYHARVRDS